MRERLAGPRAWFAVAILAALLAIVATLLARPVERDVLVAGIDLPAGATIEAGALSVVRVADGGGLSGIPAGLSEAIGRRTAVPLVAGEPLTRGALARGDWRIATGERAMPVPTSALSTLGLGPGDRVDVLASATPEAPAAARIVASDAEVLEVSPGDDGAGEAVLRVRERDALAIASALGVARDVRLVRRPDGSG